jgi:hypothetical protein
LGAVEAVSPRSCGDQLNRRIFKIHH